MADVEGAVANGAERRDSDGRAGRTDETIARALGIGRSTLYRKLHEYGVTKTGDEGEEEDEEMN